MSGKGSISRMSDECLMTLEFGFPFYVVYQAIMWKFTLAGKSHTFLLLIGCFISEGPATKKLKQGVSNGVWVICLIA